MANWYQDQLTNKNFLSPIGFLFILEKARKTSFLCQRAAIPDISLGSVDIPTRGMIPIPMEGNIVYGEFSMDFIVDEDLRNYMEIHNWYSNPHVISLASHANGIMGNENAQILLKDNGETDVFSINIIE